jgi:glycosyltransferase involved in cell wall biosynthesis
LRRIGINALYLLPGGVGGTEIYLRCLLEEFSRLDCDAEFLVFTNRETGASILPPGGRLQVSVQPVSAANRPWRILHEQAWLPIEAGMKGVGVLLNPGFTAPLLSPAPGVTVFHDLQHLRHPEFFRWFDLPFWKLLLFSSAVSSEFLIAVSRHTYDDLLRSYPVDPARLRLVPHGVERRFFGLRWEPSAQPYLLCVSTLHPHKNLERLLRMFAQFRSSRPAFRLILAGMHGFRAAGLQALIHDLGLTHSVELPGWIARERLYALYRGAHAFVYPSQFEGFGLPVLEAMAAGIPTACSGIEPLRALAADATLLFDPLSDDALRDALERITSDEALRARLHLAGPRRAADFSWNVTARETLGVLYEAAGWL